MTHDRPVGIVLAGGASTRMGVDKATMVVDGKPLAVRVADALWEASCHPVECQGGDVAAIAEYGLDAHPDTEPGGGPVAAIRDALRRHAGSSVLVAACDLVDLDATTVGAVIEAGRAGADVAVATTEGDRHLLVWWRAGAVERLDAALEAGERSFRGVLDQFDTTDVAVAPGAVRNLNSPTDVDDRG